MLVYNSTDTTISSVETGEERLSGWMVSGAKRLIDILLVLASLPVLLPLLAAIAVAVWASDSMPVLFRQVRVGRNGRRFTIYKFRTMKRIQRMEKQTIASMSNGQVTRVGRALRRLKLDELPQVLNVLKGDMSLVGPRPKIPGHQLVTSSCRPGITGPATLAFAREETLFASIPRDLLADYYRFTVLPLKHKLDADYMARATLLSDLEVLFKTVTGCWEEFTTEHESTEDLEIAIHLLRQEVLGLNSSDQ